MGSIIDCSLYSGNLSLHVLYSHVCITDILNFRVISSALQVLREAL